MGDSDLPGSLLPDSQMAMKTLVLGLGNPIISDDGVGFHVSRAVASRVAGDLSGADLTCAQSSLGGLRLLDLMGGYGRAVIVDAIQTRDGRPGDVYRLHAGELQWTLHSGSSHDLSLSGALALGRALGMSLPPDEAIVLIAVEAEDVLAFGETCTPAVMAAIPRAVEAVLAELGMVRSSAI